MVWSVAIWFSSKLPTLRFTTTITPPVLKPQSLTVYKSVSTPLRHSVAPLNIRLNLTNVLWVTRTLSQELINKEILLESQKITMSPCVLLVSCYHWRKSPWVTFKCDFSSRWFEFFHLSPTGRFHQANWSEDSGNTNSFSATSDRRWLH